MINGFRSGFRVNMLKETQKPKSPSSLFTLQYLELLTDVAISACSDVQANIDFYKQIKWNTFSDGNPVKFILPPFQRGIEVQHNKQRELIE